jgi:N-methylhydantoinase B/oxoprolinase/acetone carboxylase alpha subunit
MMTRYEDWPERMEAALQRWAAVPFIRDRTDCVEYAIDMIFTITGERFVNPAHGEYWDERSASRSILKRGANLREVVSLYLGDTIAVAFAQRGDIVLDGNNLGVCIGAEVLFRSETGLMRKDLLACACAWRIG